jgi:hypothetical protein
LGIRGFEASADGSKFDQNWTEDIAKAAGRITNLGLYPQVPARYVIFRVSNTYYRRDGASGVVDDSNASAATLIQAALDDLTAGRTWKEKIACRGFMEDIGAQIDIPSYTIIDNYEARYKAAAGLNASIFQADTVTDIEVKGGIYNGNRANLTGGPANCLRFVAVTRGIQRDIYAYDGYDQGCSFADCIDGYASNIWTSGNGRNGLYIYNPTGVTVSKFVSEGDGTRIAENGLGIGDGTPSEVMLDQIHIRGSLGRGLGIWGVENGWFSNIYVYDSAEEGIRIATSSNSLVCHNIHMTNIVSNGNTYDGLLVVGATGEATGPYDISVVGGQFNDNAQNGIKFQWVNTNHSFNAKLGDLDVVGNGYNGITSNPSVGFEFTDFKFHNLRVMNNNFGGGATYDGILLYNTERASVIDCELSDDQGAATQNYGLRETGTSDNNVVLRNIYRNNVAGPVLLIGTGDTVHELWVPVWDTDDANVSSSSIDHTKTVMMANNQDVNVRFNFGVPHFFHQMLDADLEIISAQATPTIRWQLATGWGAYTEAYAVHTDDTGLVDTDFGQNNVYGLDISTGLDSGDLAANDRVAIQFIRNGAHANDDAGDTHIRGFRFRYV